MGVFFRRVVDLNGVLLRSVSCGSWRSVLNKNEVNIQHGQKVKGGVSS